jgi:oligopeptide transport system permease protein
MSEPSVPAIMAPPRGRDNPLTRSLAGMIGMGILGLLVLLCLGTLPYTLSSAGVDREGRALGARYKHGDLAASLLPPFWAAHDENERERLLAAATSAAADNIYAHRRAEVGPDAVIDEDQLPRPTEAQINAATPRHWLGTDKLGRDLLIRLLAGGGVSIGIGLSAAAISVLLGTLYGAIAGYIGGRADAIMMRIVDVLYGLPYILLVVLLAVAGDALLGNYISREPARRAYVTQAMRALEREPAAAIPAARERLEAEARDRYPPREVSDATRTIYEVGVLLVAIGGVSWLTMSRVIRGQVLSLRSQPFMEAARAIGTPVPVQFLRHLLPNLLGPIIVYATLTVPQAILQESFLSFLGIGVRPPLPSWGNLASDGLVELNPVRIRWWLIVCPCLLLAVTLLSLNFVGEGLREALDPRRERK